MTKKEKVKNSVGWNVAVALLLEATRSGFRRLRRVIVDTFSLAEHDLPTYYYVTKYQPKIQNDLFEVDHQYAPLTQEKILKKAKRTKSDP